MKENEKFPYEDIVDLPHPVSKVHPPMSLQDRAAQFSPFAALTGHEEAIQETARLTDIQIELDEDTKVLLNEKLQVIQDRWKEAKENTQPGVQVSLTYFLPDERKAGGEYVTRSGVVKKVDDFQRSILLEDGTIVPIWRIKEIDILS